MTVTTADLERALSRFTYKPGWTFTVVEDLWQGGRLLEVRGTVVDSFHPDCHVRLHVKIPVPPVATVDEFYQFVKWRLARHELHEVEEWAKVDGRPIVNPHARSEVTRG